ncbi:MAG TPA: hypothetical protein VGR03_16105 [Candidatus Acidoferrum sp.]|nr:hypothetical protein [Candidatus Acidoferrum sp.]
MKVKTLITSLLLPAALLWGSDTKPVFNLPPATHAKTYPAHESHDDERVSIAIDPFDLPEKTAVFKVNYKQNEFLPIRLIISNDADKIVMLNDLKILYITVKRDKIEPAANEDIYRRLTKADARADKPRVQPPVPRKTKPAVSKEAVEEIDSLQFLTLPVAAHSTHSGFLFFDISGIDTPETGAHVYVTGLKIDGKELFYFDIPLEKYLSYRPGK